jgi:type VII secretion protein EssB
MKEKTIEFESMTLPFSMETNIWQLNLPKSQTKVKNMLELSLILEPSDFFVPVTIEEEEDSFNFSFSIDPTTRKWGDITKLNRNDKLRLLCNLARFKACLSTRFTFFLHPENLVFNKNLTPFIVYRGIRNLVPPYEMDEQKFLKQFKCLIIALFSKKYTFDDLYSGSLKNAIGTEFDRKVIEAEDLVELISFLEASYLDEQKLIDEKMQLVSKKRFSLFKQLAIIMVVVSVLLAVPLIYLWLVKLPYQEKLLLSHRNYLASDYGEVIHTLHEQDPENLPITAKYILAYSYIKVENLSDKEKEVIMKNITLKSNEDYLLYWIYNGRGDFIKSIDLAKYIDDPSLIMYGLIKKIEQDKNNPDLTGVERDEEVGKSQAELEKYREKYNLTPEDDGGIESEGEEGEQTLAEPEEKENEQEETTDIE